MIYCESIPFQSTFTLPKTIMRKLFVIDTSVLIHDPECLYEFKGNDVGIPIFVIIELDDLKERKKGKVAHASRQASRTIQEIQGADGDLQNGVYLEEQDITVKVIGTTGGVGIQALQENNNPRKMDLWIMQSALDMRAHYDKVVLVSKDLNLRLLSKGEGLDAEDYEKDKTNVSELNKGFRFIGNSPMFPKTYIPDIDIPTEEFIDDPLPNEMIVGTWDNKQFVVQNQNGFLKPIPRHFDSSITPRNIEQRMAMHLLTSENIRLVSLVGKAGTGKTIIALACAMGLLGNGYQQVILSKPIVDMGNSIGFLPGDMEEKMAPWVASYYDNFDKIMPSQTTLGNGKRKEPNWKYLLETQELIIQPLNSIRGRSIDQAFMIIDEAQNLTPHELKTIITRAGEGTKVVIMGDPFQVDSPFMDQNSNGLTYVTDKMKHSTLFGSVFFSQGVRSDLAEEAANLL